MSTHYTPDPVPDLVAAARGLVDCFTAHGAVMEMRDVCEARARAVRIALANITGEAICPRCFSLDYTAQHTLVTGIETTYKSCDECDHQWGHE